MTHVLSGRTHRQKTRSQPGCGNGPETLYLAVHMNGQGHRLATALLPATLLVVSANRHRLQRRFDQTKRDTEVMKPVLEFLFHGAPFRVMLSDRVL